MGHFERIEQLTSARVEEGLELPLELTRAQLDLARAKERLHASESDYELFEADLRRVLGLGTDLRLQPLPAHGPESWELPASVSEAERRALEEHPELAALQAQILATRQRAREARSGRYPKLDIVGQYAMLARFNNYDDYFRRFQRHNWQAGVALQIPLFTGRGVAERVARARLEERELQLRQSAKGTALELEGRRAYASLREAEHRNELAKQELNYARESVDVLLAQFEEDSIALDELERARLLESSAWGAWSRPSTP